jgi:Flp pilus assembly pilin Flp
MKSFIARLLRNQSGAVGFEDGLTVFSLTIGFIAALALMNGTFVQLFVTILHIFSKTSLAQQSSSMA